MVHCLQQEQTDFAERENNKDMDKSRRLGDEVKVLRSVSVINGGIERPTSFIIGSRRRSPTSNSKIGLESSVDGLN
jgi:hypothetical protein